MTAPRRHDRDDAPAVDPGRMLDDLRTLRTIGSVGGGVARTAFSEADVEARRWLAARMEAAGLRPVFDPWGNLFGMPPGPGPFLLMGSHTDSQPLGGWLDGAYGVMAALEVARAAIEIGCPAPAVVSFQDEEGWFGLLTGSAIWTGLLQPDEADALVDRRGARLGDLRRAILGLASQDAPSPERFFGFLEAHIEQGATLAADGLQVAAVSDIVGMRSATVTIEGSANHAGTTPMRLRKDAVAALAEIAVALEARLPDPGHPASVWTIGRIEVEPNAPSIVPGRALFDVQWRDRDESRLEAMERTVGETVAEVCDRRGLGRQLDPAAPIRPTRMDPGLVSTIETACAEVAPGRWRRMVSGALHDAANVSRRLPSAMLFVPSIGGISHNPAEDTEEADLIAGLRVLARAARRLGASS